mmetsp:Transcript_19405/g.35150  ORF Transcript_19405/g.35150 Transcript_19405/m.35150 type:complete len:234 (+) Transcript_19405:226-927(+)
MYGCLQVLHVQLNLRCCWCHTPLLPHLLDNMLSSLLWLPSVPKALLLAGSMLPADLLVQPAAGLACCDCGAPWVCAGPQCWTPRQLLQLVHQPSMPHTDAYTHCREQQGPLDSIGAAFDTAGTARGQPGCSSGRRRGKDNGRKRVPSEVDPPRGRLGKPAGPSVYVQLAVGSAVSRSGPVSNDLLQPLERPTLRSSHQPLSRPLRSESHTLELEPLELSTSVRLFAQSTAQTS